MTAPEAVSLLRSAADMSDEEYAEHRDEIMAALAVVWDAGIKAAESDDSRG